MDKLTQKIKVLNEVYLSMKGNYDILKGMFKSGNSIHQKFLLSEEILGQAYMLIMDTMETEEVNRLFTEIIKGTKKRG